MQLVPQCEERKSRELHRIQQRFTFSPYCLSLDERKSHRSMFATRPTMRGKRIQGKARELLPIPPPTRKKISIVIRYTISYIPTRKKGKSLLQLSPLLPTRKTGRSALPVLPWLPPISLRRRRQSSLT